MLILLPQTKVNEGGGILEADPQQLTNVQEGSFYTNSAVGAFSIGYGRTVRNSIYLGGELSYNIGNRRYNLVDSTYYANYLTSRINRNINSNSQALTTNTQTQLNFNECDIDFKPGILVGQATLLYGRIGGAFNRMHVKSTSTLTTTDTLTIRNIPLPTQSQVNYSGLSNIAALRVGIGAERFITKRLSAKLDYTYTWHGSNSSNGVADVFNTFSGAKTDGALTSSTYAKMATQAFMVGITYYFHNVAEK
jgi:hypothetical protein